jgi:hypothetical protein
VEMEGAERPSERRAGVRGDLVRDVGTLLRARIQDRPTARAYPRG